MVLKRVSFGSMKKYLRKFWGKKSVVAFLSLAIATVLVIATAQPALGAVQVATSTISTATADSHQRKTWYDGTRYWAAFYNGTSIVFYYSTNGTSWTQNASATITTNATNDFTVYADSSRAFISYPDGIGDLFISSATSYPGTGFGWSSPSNAIIPLNQEQSPAMSLDSSGYIHLCWIDSAGTIPNSYTWYCQKSTNQYNSPSGWSSATTVGAGTTSFSMGDVAPLASQNMYSVYANGATLFGKQYTNGTGWAGSATTIATVASANINNNMSLTGDTTNNAVYLSYFDSSGHTVFQKYTSGAWQSAVTLDSNAGNSNTSLSYDSANSKLYAFWIRSNTTFCQSSSSPYTSWSTCSGFSSYSTSTNSYLSAVAYRNGAGLLPFIWTSGTASPYSAMFDSLTISSNTAPAAPTLSIPANAATGVSATPSFQLKTTDADNDYLRYRIYLCTVSGCNSGTALYTWDQTTSQVGWTGQDQQSGTAYTGNSVLAGSTTASFQPSILLTVGQTYYWVAQAIDPGGTNSWGSLSSASSFTTTASQVNINGGTNITGGTTIQ